MLEFLTKNLDTIITIVVIVFPIVWSIFKGTDAYRRWTSDKNWKWMALAGEIASAAVDKTYRDKVRAMKRDAGGEKLTLEQIEEINEYAWEQFQEEAKVRGLDIGKITKNSALSMIQDKVQEKKESESDA